MSSILTREKAVRPLPASRSAEAPAASATRTVVVTRAELADCTCPEHCERDHSDE